MRSALLILGLLVITIWLTIGTISTGILYAQWKGYCHFAATERQQPTLKYASAKAVRDIFDPVDNPERY